MQEPVISKDFTLEDIRKIRTYNAWRHRQMSIEEQIAEAKAVRKDFDEYMAKRGVVREGNIYRKKGANEE
jgi:hypothetical protein